MIYTPLTKKAMKFCYEAHQGQLDKSGLPYVMHPLHLAESMPDENTTIAALLHDIVEDTQYTIIDLTLMGLPEEVIEALKLLTHDKDVPYMEYIKNLRDNTIAATVKMADLKHNSDLSRLDEVDDKARERVKKYEEAMDIITRW